MRNSWRRPDEEGRGEEKSRMWQRIQSRPDFSEEKARVWENVRQRSEDYASEKQRVWAEVGKAEHSPGFGKASAGPQSVRVERGMFRAERRRVRRTCLERLRGGKSVRLGKDCPRQKGNCFGKNPRVGKNLFFGQNSPLRREKKGGRRKKAHLEDAEKSVLRKKEAGKI